MNTLKLHNTLRNRIGILIILGLIYLLSLSNIIWQAERILKTGAKYRFQLQPIDPYDAFRGRYVRLFYGNLQAPPRDSLSIGQYAYVSLRKDAEGFASFDGAYAQPPKSNQDYLRVRISYLYEGAANFDLPENIRYFYLNEKIAPQVERLILQPRAPDSAAIVRAAVDIRILRGKAMVENMYLNEQPVQDFFREKQ